MARLTKLNDLMFPVGEHPVFVDLGDEAGRRISVPDKKAIVNVKTRRVLGVVGRGYRLVSNREALEMAMSCCVRVFPETRPEEWEASAFDAPASGGYCYMDITHNSTALDFRDRPPDQRPDAYGPFIRVTNSYNAKRALSFEIGFYRKVCKNGLILPQTIIRFKFSHQQRDLDEFIHFDIDHERLTAFRSGFANMVTALRNCQLARWQFEPLIRGALQLRPPQSEDSRPAVAEDWQKLVAHVGELRDRYAKELGDNAYAAFNAITEFSSRPPENRCVHRDRNSYQRLAGGWLATFSDECKNPGFNLNAYLTGLARASPEKVAQV